MNKKLPVLILTGVLAGALTIPAMAADASVPAVPVPISAEETVSLPASVLYYGTVDKIVRGEDGAATQLWMTSERYGEYVMNLSEETLWIDSGNQTKDDPSDLKEGESLYVFHSAVVTASLPPQSSAIAVVRNIPADAGCAQYHEVESVSLKDGKLTITTDNGGLLIYADSETGLSRYDSDKSLALADLQAGDRIMAWYYAVADSYPAQTTASHLMLLPDEAETPSQSGLLTRADLVTMLHESAGSPVVNYAMTYSDVAQDADYAEAVRWASSEKIVNGYDDGGFRPDAPVTREQLAVILYRYAQQKGQGFTGAWAFPLDYADANQVSEYAYEAVCWMTMKGILPEAGENRIDPDGTVSAEQGADIFARFLEQLDA